MIESRELDALTEYRRSGNDVKSLLDRADMIAEGNGQIADIGRIHNRSREIDETEHENALLIGGEFGELCQQRHKAR